PMQYVFVPDGPKFVKRPVKVGRRSEQMAEISSGLSEGEIVLLRQPDAGEILGREPKDEELAAVGIQRTEDGKLVRIDSPRRGGERREAAATSATAPGEEKADALADGEAESLEAAPVRET